MTIVVDPEYASLYIYRKLSKLLGLTNKTYVYSNLQTYGWHVVHGNQHYIRLGLQEIELEFDKAVVDLPANKAPIAAMGNIQHTPMKSDNTIVLSPKLYVKYWKHVNNMKKELEAHAMYNYTLPKKVNQIRDLVPPKSLESETKE